jgi:hypothetical protein
LQPLPPPLLQPQLPASSPLQLPQPLPLPPLLWLLGVLEVMWQPHDATWPWLQYSNLEALRRHWPRGKRIGRRIEVEQLGERHWAHSDWDFGYREKVVKDSLRRLGPIVKHQQLDRGLWRTQSIREEPKKDWGLGTRSAMVL